MPTTHSTRDYIESALDHIETIWSKPESSARKSGNFGVLALDVFDVFDVGPWPVTIRMCSPAQSLLLPLLRLF